MTPLRLVLAIGVALALVVEAAHAADKSVSRHPVALVAVDGAVVYSRPSTHSPRITTLVQQTQVEVLGFKGSWDHVLLWVSVRGWISKRSLAQRGPWVTVSHYRAPTEHTPVRSSPPQRISVTAVTTAQTPLETWPDGRTLKLVAAGTTLHVSAWQQDAAGGIWYRIGQLWAPGPAVRFETPDPGLARYRGALLWKKVSGKGMWLTLGTSAVSDADAVARAAAADGVTHLYVESAISPLGFHGRDSVGPLIVAAHRRGIAVIAWVYPYLEDIAADVALTRRVADFRTTHGDRFDGIAADLEDNISETTVRAYSQLIRASMGPNYLLVGVTYPPSWSSSYPFAEVARQYNLIAPMDYWHQTKTAYGLDYGNLPYGYQYSYHYAVDSVTAIRRVSGHVPVAPIGQSFDNFGRMEMGPYAPSADEITGFLAGCKASGAVGASFFQWMTTTDAEWRAIRRFPI